MRFRDVTISDYHAIQSYADKYGENSCQHSFITLFTLQEKYGSQFCIEDGFLFVLRSRLCTDGFRTYLFPMGGGSMKRAVEAVLEDAHEHDAKARFQTITEEKRDWLCREFPGAFEYEETRDYAEYIHLSENMAALAGKDYAKRRGGINSVRRRYEGRLRVEDLTPERIGEVLEYERHWLEVSREDHDARSLELEYREIEKQLAYFEALRISGIILRIDGEIQGFGYGAGVSDTCFDAIIAKANREIKYIYHLLHNELAKLAVRLGYRYFDAEEDLGIPGLRSYKLSYHPDILLGKHIATEK